MEREIQSETKSFQNKITRRQNDLENLKNSGMLPGSTGLVCYQSKDFKNVLTDKKWVPKNKS